MPPNLLVVGVGPHARQNHLPALARLREQGLIGEIVGYDLATAAGTVKQSGFEIVEQFRSRSGLPQHMYYIDDPIGATRTELPADLTRQLDEIVGRHHIEGVIVACEATAHFRYAFWALRRGLHLLVDKPPVMRRFAARDTGEAQAISEDYAELIQAYADARSVMPGLAAVVMCQRRFQPLYREVWSRIREVELRTGCGVTSMQSYNADGQWRLPQELIDIPYHSYDRGFGKIAHSGYHLIDYVTQTVQIGDNAKGIDTIELFVNPSHTADYLEQVGWAVAERCLGVTGDAEAHAALDREIAEHGEVDAFISLAFKRRGRVVTMGSINLLHTSISLRDNPASEPDWYRGNGRLRHEAHTVQQGPFQAIYLRSLRSGDRGRPPGAAGSHSHYEVEVFRNNRLIKEWEGYERFTVDELTSEAKPDDSAREAALQEFAQFITGAADVGDSTSDLREHAISSAILAGAYESVAARAENGNPMVTIAIPQM